MQPTKPVVLFDIDYTLFDTALYRDALLPSLLKHLGQHGNPEAKKIAETIYYHHRKRVGYFDLSVIVQEIIHEFAVDVDAKDIFQKLLNDEESYDSSLYEETKETLQILSRIKNLRIGIFSGGRTDHQLKKIKSVSQFFQKEHVHIFTIKEQHIEKTFKKYTQEKAYFVDDVLKVLYEVKQYNKNVITIWSKRGKMALNAQPIEGFKADYTITHLSELLPIVKGEK